MAAKGKGAVRESIAELDDYGARMPGGGTMLRLRMLRLLIEEPSRTLAEVAALLDHSPRTIYRWWRIYREQGIEGLLEEGDGARASARIRSPQVEELRQALLTGQLGSLSEVQLWLQSRFGVHYSLRGISDLLARIGARRVWEIRGERGSSGEPFDADKARAALLDFMNKLPVRYDTLAWIEDFRTALMDLLGDVDRITITVNTSCNLLDPQNYNPNADIAQDIHGRSIDNVTVSTIPRSTVQKTADQILEELRRWGYPLHEYHDPDCFDYFYEGHAYLGTVFLWRSRSNPPTSRRTVRFIEELNNFMIFALSDLIVRHHYANPAERVFYEALRSMVISCNLTQQERRVISYRLFGYSYKEIADKLDVAQDRVKKLLQSVHRKTATRSHVELFAKYFTPRILPPEPP